MAIIREKIEIETLSIADFLKKYKLDVRVTFENQNEWHAQISSAWHDFGGMSLWQIFDHEPTDAEIHDAFAMSLNGQILNVPKLGWFARLGFGRAKIHLITKFGGM